MGELAVGRSYRAIPTPQLCLCHLTSTLRQPCLRLFCIPSSMLLGTYLTLNFQALFCGSSPFQQSPAANRQADPRRSVNLLKWKCQIPGKDNTDWAGGFYPLTMEFTEDYPAKPPKARTLHKHPVVTQHARPTLRQTCQTVTEHDQEVTFACAC